MNKYLRKRQHKDHLAKQIRQLVPNVVTNDPSICEAVAEELNLKVGFVTAVLSGKQFLTPAALPENHPLCKWYKSWSYNVKKNYIRRQSRNYRPYLMKIQNGMCNYCQRIFDEVNFHTVDHKIPISRDGDDSLTNLQLLCKSCNNLKSNATDFEYRSSRI